jgi:ATP-dependent Lon protease
MRRAWMTAFGNAKLARRDHVMPVDLPEGGPRKGSIGFVQ